MSDLKTELLAIGEEAGGLTARAVVTAAAPEDHPLHDRFEWDNEIGGDKYRLEQARRLIKVVHEKFITREGSPERVTTFHSMPSPNGRVYRPIEEIADDDVGSKILLMEMERDWRLLRKRYASTAGFLEMVRRDLGEAVA